MIGFKIGMTGLVCFVFGLMLGFASFGTDVAWAKAVAAIMFFGGFVSAFVGSMISLWSDWE